MLRLLTCRKVAQVNYKLLTRQNEVNLAANAFQPIRSSHCLCKNFRSTLLGRFSHASVNLHPAVVLSTDTSLATGSRAEKRRKKRKRKFLELMQVTNGVKQTKTTVKSLKAESLSKFIEGDTLGDEYKKVQIDMLDANQILRTKLHEDYPIIFVNRNQRSLELTNVDLKDILESFATHKESLTEEVDLEALAEDPIETELPTSLVFKSRNHRTTEDEMKHRNKSLQLNLMSYMDICVATGLINRGVSAIINYRYKYKNVTPEMKTFLNIDLFNILISGFADKGNWVRIREIVKILKEDRIPMNAQTFAGILECLGRLETTDEVRLDIVKYIQLAESTGITMSDIMDKSKFVNDKREIVLSTLQLVDENFQPKYTPPKFLYSNPLVDHLNDFVMPIEEKFEGNPSKEYINLARDQLKGEVDGYITVKNVAKFSPPTPIVLHYRQKLDELNQLWHSQICSAFHRDLNSMRAHAQTQNIRAMNLFPYLRTLEVRQFADLLIKEVRSLCEGSETYSPSTTHLYRDLGKKVQNKFLVERKRRLEILEKMGDVYSEYCDIVGSQNGDNLRQTWQRIVHHNMDGPSLDLVEKPWPMAAQIGVGKFLYNIMFNDLKVDTNATRLKAKNSNLLPAIYTLYRYHGKLARHEVKPHPTLIKLYRGSQQENLIFDSNLVPMVCPPRPWSDSHNGGYLLMKSDLIRLPSQAIQQLNRIEEMPAENLYPALDALNQLANVPWKVNNELLDIILEVFNNGGSEKLDVPRPPSALNLPPELMDDKDATKEEKSKTFRAKLMHERQLSEMYSLWCDALYRLSLANHFRDKKFWLPHNMDFRGRVYPVPPHLSHLGSDLARSLLVFHDAKPLGPNGFAWLKLHCINLTGIKKRAPVSDRLVYADQVMDDILDSADNPLTGRMWWADSDEPWQTLSACIEIAKVSRCPNPAEYLSCFPIHQDGSCNGLQHYAALGRDTAGAMSVNLSPSSVPQDVYSDVAELVEEMRRKDAAGGNNVAQILDGFVRRKVIKQTIMTTVYGVTRYGARLQIAKQLKDIDDFPKDFVWQASSYLTVKTFESLREMFASTKEIQDWFTECARQISTLRGQNVEWVTPLGLPVVQPYNRVERKFVKKGKMTETPAMDMYERPNIMKQKNAFPPNFVHSLDSSHMMLTSLYCEKAGLTFISVHDCYWTHACTVPMMNKICREQFVALHSQEILHDLSKSLVNRYGFDRKEFAFDGSVSDMSKKKLNKILEKVPSRGDFNLKKVLKSVYFFS